MCQWGNKHTNVNAESKVCLPSQKHWSLLVTLRMQLEKETSVAVIVKHLMSVAIGLVHFPVLSLPENKIGNSSPSF